MALEVTERWMTIRIGEKYATARLYASASDGDKSATGARDVELPKQLVKDLQEAIDDNAEMVDEDALANLHQSRQIDRGAEPPDGVKAIKLDGGLGMKGEAARRKD